MIQAFEKRSAAPPKPKVENVEGEEEKEALPATPASSNGPIRFLIPRAVHPDKWRGLTEPSGHCKSFRRSSGLAASPHFSYPFGDSLRSPTATALRLIPAPRGMSIPPTAGIGARLVSISRRWRVARNVREMRARKIASVIRLDQNRFPAPSPVPQFLPPPQIGGSPLTRSTPTRTQIGSKRFRLGSCLRSLSPDRQVRGSGWELGLLQAS